MGALLRPPRAETGVRLVLISLVLATLSIVVSPFLYAAIVGGLSDPAQAFGWHIFVLPGIALALGGALGATGVVGLWILEWDRRRGADPLSRRWDRQRVALVVTVVVAAIQIGSGIVLGFVHIPWFQALAVIRAALWATLTLTSGLFLYWTAERIDPGAARLSQLGFALGTASGIIPGMTIAASLLGPVAFDPILGGVLGGAATGIGTLSLLAWIIVYGGILVRLGSRERAPVVAS